MQNQDNAFKKFHDSFSNMRGHFHILEQSVSIERQLEYFKYSEKMKDKYYPVMLTSDEFAAIVLILSSPETEESALKTELSRLALSHDVKAYRILEDYARHPREDVKEWVQLAFMECKMGLESDLSDEKQIFISTGLGGKGESLRFFVLFMTSDKQPFAEYQRKVVEREFEYYLSKQGCVIERLDIEEQYVVLLFLVPVRADLKAILDYLVNECNQYGNFLSDLFTVTNTKELSRDEIMNIINKDGDSKTGD